MAIVNYITLAELKARIGSSATPGAALYEQLTSRAKPHTAGDDAVGQRAIDDTAAVMASFLKKPYGTLPITDADALLSLKLCNHHLAHHELYLGTPGLTVPDDIQKARDECMRWLLQISQGKVELQSSVKADRGSTHGGDRVEFTQAVRDCMD